MNLKSCLVSLCLVCAAAPLRAQQESPPEEHQVAAMTGSQQDQSPAGLIGSRAELESLLGNGTTDDFETYEIADGDGVRMHSTQLDHTSIINGQGPNLVHEGAQYYSLDDLAWLGNGNSGIPTRTILAFLSNKITIQYDVPTQAMGVDLYYPSGASGSVTVRVISTSGSRLATNDFTVQGNGTPVFVGYRFDQGIGFVDITSNDLTISAILNDHTYGALCLSDGCNGAETLSAKVTSKTCGCQVQAILKHGTSGAAYAFSMPDGECLSAVANHKGKAKVKQCPSHGGQVYVTSCGLEVRVRCP